MVRLGWNIGEAVTAFANFACIFLSMSLCQRDSAAAQSYSSHSPECHGEMPASKLCQTRTASEVKQHSVYLKNTVTSSRPMTVTMNSAPRLIKLSH